MNQTNRPIVVDHLAKQQEWINRMRQIGLHPDTAPGQWMVRPALWVTESTAVYIQQRLI